MSTQLLIPGLLRRWLVVALILSLLPGLPVEQHRATASPVSAPAKSHNYYIHVSSTHTLEQYEHYCIRIMDASMSVTDAYNYINDALYNGPGWHGLNGNRIFLQSRGVDCSALDLFTLNATPLEYQIRWNAFNNGCSGAYNCNNFNRGPFQFPPFTHGAAQVNDWTRSIITLSGFQLSDYNQRRAAVNHETAHAFGLSDPMNTYGRYCGNSVMHSNFYGCANDPYHPHDIYGNSLNIPWPSDEDKRTVRSISNTGQAAGPPYASFRDKFVLFGNDGFWFLANGGQDGPRTDPVTYSSVFFAAANPSYVKPVMGDWNGSGRKSIGYLYYDGSGPWGYFYLANDPLNPYGGYSSVSLCCLQTGDIPFSIRQYQNFSKSAIGIYRPGTSQYWWKEDTLSGQYFEHYVRYGGGGYNEVPVIGDWTGTGYEKVGLYYKPGNTFYLRDHNQIRYDGSGNEVWWAVAPDQVYTWGCSACGDVPVVGDWSGDGVASIGLYTPSSAQWRLKDSEWGLASPDLSLWFGGTTFTPLSGAWYLGY